MKPLFEGAVMKDNHYTLSAYRNHAEEIAAMLAKRDLEVVRQEKLKGRFSMIPEIKK
jgi:hypothetical protein